MESELPFEIETKSQKLFEYAEKTVRKLYEDKAELDEICKVYITKELLTIKVVDRESTPERKDMILPFIKNYKARLSANVYLLTKIEDDKKDEDTSTPNEIKIMYSGQGSISYATFKEISFE